MPRAVSGRVGAQPIGVAGSISVEDCGKFAWQGFAIASPVHRSTKGMISSNLSIEGSDSRNPCPSGSAATHVRILWRSKWLEVATDSRRSGDEIHPWPPYGDL